MNKVVLRYRGGRTERADLAPGARRDDKAKCLGDLQGTAKLTAHLAGFQLPHKSNADTSKAGELFLSQLLGFSLGAHQCAEGSRICNDAHHHPSRDENSMLQANNQ